MDRNLKEIESEVLRLDRHARANLARTLLDSLEDLSEEEYDQLWAEEAEARYADFKAGRSRAIGGEEVFRRARARNG
ncbi:MAG: addiction module protein [Acidobacteria bacterium]|nr:addiction module protein [Acidobacteriota bacterium]MBV9070555.1 addiction module protein [Acidobacteriota bacterium]MBV9188573.1 addiction module protein [Acidobacteriota bacterium]